MYKVQRITRLESDLSLKTKTIDISTFVGKNCKKNVQFSLYTTVLKKLLSNQAYMFSFKIDLLFSLKWPFFPKLKKVWFHFHK